MTHLGLGLRDGLQIPNSLLRQTRATPGRTPPAPVDHQIPEPPPHASLYAPEPAPRRRYLRAEERLGSYEIVRASKEGGTCEIYHARHMKHGFRAIARVTRRDALTNHPWVGERMLTNAEIVAESSHANLMRILDYGLTDELSPRPYVITERIVGRDLAAYLETHGRLSVELACEVGLQLARGIAELHRLGLVHGDLKPSNIMISIVTDGSVRIVLIDFDLARDLEEPRAPGLSPGTPSYLPPEHSIGLRPSVHFDIYALGVILHELLLGECPVDAESCLAALEEQHEWPQICPLHLEHPELGVPRALSRLIARLCHRDRCRRPKDLAAVERSLAKLYSRFGPRAPTERSLPPTRPPTMTPSVGDHVAAAIASRPRGPSWTRARQSKSWQTHAETVAAPQAQGHLLLLPEPVMQMQPSPPPTEVATTDVTSAERTNSTNETPPIGIEAVTGDERPSTLLSALVNRRHLRLIAAGSALVLCALIGYAAKTGLAAGDEPTPSDNESALQVHEEAPQSHATAVVEPAGHARPEPEAGAATTPASKANEPNEQDEPKAKPREVAPEEAPPSPQKQPTSKRPKTRHTGSAIPRPHETKTATATPPASTLSELPPPPAAESVAVVAPAQREEASAAPADEAPVADNDHAKTRRSAPRVVIPKVTGMPLAAAKAALRKSRVKHKVRSASADECFFREGTVISQSFEPGTAITRDLPMRLDYCQSLDDA